ncbi:MAG: UvrD-helicase domain-containing protein, partial [Elusimicrobiaceae bacterium]|nr:UvrD-helicase domain-containing protein [Elusimicrobiaceae bacterium]
AEQALLRLDRAVIGTIHGFCAEILKMFPLEAHLSPNAQIDSGYRAAQIFEEHWNRFLDKELGVEAPRASTWKQVLAEISLNDLEVFAQELCAVTPVPYDYYAHRRLLGAQCAQKAARLSEFYTFYVKEGKKPRNIEKALCWAAQSLKRTESFLQGKTFPSAPEEACPTPSACKDWTPEDFEEAKDLINFAQKVTPESQQLFLSAYHLLLPLAQTVRAAQEEQGVLGFDALIIKTRNLLQQNLYVRRVLKEKFDALFIDEFQDTDPVQGELLLFLAEEKAGAATRWQDVRLEPGKLFVVGDPKQSIYRFRGADITAYELFTDLILKQGGEKSFLQTNFRSEPEIIETANQICARAMVQESAFQPAYVPIFTDKPTGAKAVDWLFITPPTEGKPGADDFRHNQAEQLARWICQQVGVLSLKDGRKLTYRDIALLTRVGTTSRIFTDALRRYGVPFNTDTDKDFFRKQEINDLILLLRVAADPEDKIALSGVLRSPFGGLTDEELYQVVKAGELHLPALLKNGRTKSCAEYLQTLCQLAGRVSLTELINRMFEGTFLPEACAVAYDGERTLAYLHQVAALAAQYEAQNGNNLTEFLTDFQTRLAQNPDLLTLPPTDESADAVSILTVHKSKGLEFPVVLLADLPRKESAGAVRPPQHLFSWQYNMYGLRAGKICDINLAFLEEEQKKHSRCEEVRILYVALTRAKEKLILVADGRTGAEKAAMPFAAAGLWPDGQTPKTVSPDGVLQLPVLYAPYIPPRDFLYCEQTVKPISQNNTKNWTLWHQAYKVRKAAYDELIATAPKRAPSEIVDSGLLIPEQQRGAELGTICHRALEVLLTCPGITLEDACTQAAQQVGACTRVQEAVQVLTPFVASLLFKEILACELIACEMPFTVCLPDGSTQDGVMDVVLKTPQGIWVVDYKTDQVQPGKETELFKKKYQTQLQAYRQAAQQIFTGQTVRASAVFIRTFAVVEG